MSDASPESRDLPPHRAPGREAAAASLAELHRLHADAVRFERAHAELLAPVAPEQRPSAANLLHYLSLRSHDLRELQERLHRQGVSSLGRSEPYALASLEAVCRVLAALSGARDLPLETSPLAPSFTDGRARMARNTEALLGPRRASHRTRVMVTMPSSAADDPALVRAWLEAGMDVARLNCAKDDPEVWGRIVDHVRAASRELGIPCRVLMDLEGPNPRTGEIANADGKRRFFLSRGELCLLGGPEREGCAARDGEPAYLGCSLPGMLRSVEVGQRVAYDDGAWEGVVREKRPDGLLVEVLRTEGERAKVRANKGLNFPESDLHELPALSDDDRAALDFVARHADLVGCSFVRSARDVEQLHAELDARGARLGTLLKIETRSGFEHLPRLLLAALRRPPVGVMIARGDMGVELGFSRMAEVQEEVLWLCSAAHVPVVWATQVLESLAKGGQPTRSEVTDAAMACRAECVMLNKGRNIEATIRFLVGVFERMEAHHDKKLATFRKLRVAQDLD